MQLAAVWGEDLIRSGIRLQRCAPDLVGLFVALRRPALHTGFDCGDQYLGKLGGLVPVDDVEVAVDRSARVNAGDQVLLFGRCGSVLAIGAFVLIIDDEQLR
jgi:hypothetical protein